METAKFLRNWGLALGAVCVFGILFPVTVYDYEISAHAALTNAMIDSYNTHFPQVKIDDSFRFDLLRGSKEEDDGSRSLYHFYDPVYNRGLTIKLRKWMASKDWAMNDSAQLAIAPYVAFTYVQGIKAYARHDNHQAFLILGHVLHLLEDLGVPEHTRNDLHPLSSPYEHFTKTLLPIIDAKNPIVLQTPTAYFDALAAYANNNFYSADTIGSIEYPYPKPEYVRAEGKYTYGFKTDEGGAPYHLVHYVQSQKYAWAHTAATPELRIDKEADKIMFDYWRLLSAQTVNYGAGLIHLFLTEGERARREWEGAKKKRNAVNTQSLMADIAGLFQPRSVLDAGDEEDELQEIASVQMDAPVKVHPRTQTVAVPVSPLLRSAKASRAAQPAPLEEKPRVCAQGISAPPLHAPLIINEVAWMGTHASSNDEWIELKNISASSVALSGWQLLSERGRVKITFPAGATISAGGFYLLERTDDQSVPSVPADVIYTGSISNSSDGLRLFSSDCGLIDEVIAAPSWPAGVSASRRTMERGRDFSWHDYSGSGVNGILGTPRAENSEASIVKPGSSTVVSVSSGTTSSVGGSGGGAASVSAALSPLSLISAGAVLINEFLFDAEESDTNKEFIELRNTTNQSIDMSGWSIQTQSAKKNFEDGNRINAGACFLVWLGSVPAGSTPDFEWKSGRLNNTAGSIYVVKNQDAVTGDTDADIIDRVTYDINTMQGFASGKSIERTDSGGLKMRAVPSPGNCSRGETAAPAVSSPASTASAGVFLKNVYFYAHPVRRGDALVDLHWDHYPFVSGRLDAWKAVLVYLNSEPSRQEFLHLSDSWAPISDAALSVQYPIYAENVFPVRRSVIFPDTRAQMGSGGLSGGVGGLDLAAFNFDRLSEDRMARITVSAKPHAGDYITLAYYDFFSSGGGDQTLRLVDASPTRYYFEKPLPIFTQPIVSGAVRGSFDAKNSIMTLHLPFATDADSEDRLLAQDLTINGVAADARWLWPDRYPFFIVPGDDFTAEYRLRDDFNVHSAPSVFSWKYPGSVQWLMTQDRADSWGAFFGQKNLDCASCPDSANFQSVSFANEIEANVFVVRLKSDYGATSASVRLTVYPDAFGGPDFTAPLGSQTVSPHENTTLAAMNNLAFVFDEPILFQKNTLYWLALDVVSYVDPVSFYRPYLRNAIFSAEDAYEGGVSAKGANGVCGSWCVFTSPYPSLAADWYLKIGWQENITHP